MKTNLIKKIVLSHREKYLKESDKILREIDEGKLPHEGKFKDPLVENSDKHMFCKSCMEKNPDLFTRCINKELDTLFLISTGDEKYCCEENEEETEDIQEKCFGTEFSNICQACGSKMYPCENDPQDPLMVYFYCPNSKCEFFNMKTDPEISLEEFGDYIPDEERE